MASEAAVAGAGAFVHERARVLQVGGMCARLCLFVCARARGCVWPGAGPLPAGTGLCACACVCLCAVVVVVVVGGEFVTEGSW